ncbi:hypothetical protein [Methylobacterium marchantiae]|uniref:Secreted protein n=1 Tax=Methylobacterium marchantiae TaxID=600331 RepID=A0ABW3WY38_9HYPH|nr:hypothetical protein AIGOOFII_2122 [Methylobacterium marchantiae]
MIRLALAAGAVALSLVSIPGAEAGDHHRRLHASHQYGPHVHAQRHRAMLPPHIPYRDPAYRPVRRAFAPVYGPPVVQGFVQPRNLNAPVYNEPPPRFLPY